MRMEGGEQGLEERKRTERAEGTGRRLSSEKRLAKVCPFLLEHSAVLFPNSSRSSG